MSIPAVQKKNTILLIEDDYSIRETVREALEFEGFEVRTAVNGEDGLEKIREGNQPHLILLDMMMPKMSGREFLDEILADAELALIPIIAVSATTDPQAAAGARDFVKKPFDLDVLLKMIAKHVK